MDQYLADDVVSLDVSRPIWERIFTVAPLAVVGTREANGGYDLAPKHLAMPMGWSNYFGFACTHDHATLRNAQREGCFTVSFPRPDQILAASFTATPRRGADDAKPDLLAVPTFAAAVIDGVLLTGAYLHLECHLDRIIGGFDVNSLVVGRIVAAHASEAFVRRMERDDHDLIYVNPLLVYLAPGRFARIKESFSFPFPVDFKR